MKLIAQYSSLTDARNTAVELESNGIAIYVSSEETNRMMGGAYYMGGAYKIGLWVMLDEQYHNAISYINNKNHFIGNALTQEQISQLKQQAENNSSKSLNTILCYLLLGLILVTLSLFVFINQYIKYNSQ